MEQVKNYNAVSQPSDERTSDLDIAIVGMSGRFPGAKNIHEFWDVLRSGRETIRFFSDEELESVDPALRENPNYVKAAPMLEDVELFDAPFFDYTPKEAEITDPQNRIFLECAWEALETAGYNPKTYPGAIGVYADKTMSMYFLRNLYSTLDLSGGLITSGNFKTLVANDRDFLSTTVSYKLNLKGPSVNVQTACSSSLVAVHLACQSLLMGECDMALAGGVAVFLPQKAGYLYEEGMMLSPDGHCRAFDARAQGTLFGSGAGVVVLKLLADAIADGDYIHGVIKGSAINNDGSAKAGYVAPSIAGQAAMIAEAQANAGVEAESISYVEAHATGTALGDPIEIAGLTRAFSEQTQKKGFCAVGSVKPNIGHLDAASGITSLIKTVLMLEHKMMVPTINFSEPNPQIDFPNSPFYVNTELKPWDTNGASRRAGVSSFGIGGTNAHVILEEAPVLDSPKPDVDRPFHLLSLSAKSAKALNEMAKQYREHLASNSISSIADVCFTANVGREHHKHRLALVADDRTQMGELLAAFAAGKEPDGLFTGKANKSKPKIAFLFTGQGSQYVNMGRELYEQAPTFRETIDRCDELLRPYLEVPLNSVLYPEDGETSPINETAYTQPALFAIEYALAQLWLSWGIQPEVAIGHSLGEYVAACIAGVFSLEDALKLVAQRGRLMQSLPPGGEMVAVFADEDCVRDAIAPYGSQLAIAVLNGPEETVISGTASAMAAFLADSQDRGLQWRRLTVSHAFHSPLMEPILDAFEQTAAELTFSSPQIPLISNLTGQLVDADDITTPRYWRRHLRETVRFADAIATLPELSVDICLEIGPHPKLSMMGRRCNPPGIEAWLSSLRKGRSDWQQMLANLGELYVRGVEVYWTGFEADYLEARCRLPLPTYPFQRQRYWIEAGSCPAPKMQRSQGNGDLHPEAESETAPKQSFRDRVLAVAPGKRFSLFRSYLCQQLVKLTGLNISDLNVEESLKHLGLKSLTILELKNQIETDLEIDLSLQQLLAAPSILELADKLNQQLTPTHPELMSVPAEEGYQLKPGQPIKQGFQPAGTSSPPLGKFVPISVGTPEEELLTTSSIFWESVNKVSTSLSSWTGPLNPQSSLRLFCFPHAGGGASIFRSWQKHLPPEIEVVPVQLPGREDRICEPAFTELAPLVATLADVLLPALDIPFAFYGHSFGALLGFELARYLYRTWRKTPVHLFVGASIAPQLLNPFEFGNHSSDSALIKLLHEFGTPAEVLENQQLMAAFLPTIKADFAALNSYVYSPSEPLDCPIAAFGGLQDTRVSRKSSAAWYEQTKSSFSLQMFPGKHLFLDSNRQLILPIIHQQLSPSCCVNSPSV